jgi:trans-2,3-dihydro-3-hydroxyanthranilate isomerase
MKKLPIMQIDAFTTKPYGGNPCAVVLEADGLSESAMQDIALEMNLSETAFVMSSNKADFRARYFTPSEEIPLAGHPTIATMYALIVNGIISYQGQAEFQLELEAGVVTVDVCETKSGRPLITMSQIRPQFLEVYEPAVVLPAFGLEESDALDGAPIMTVSTGTPQLMVPLASLEALKRARLVIDLFAELQSWGDFFSPHLFVLEGVSERGSTFARHFGLPPDTYEDPFTGSATGGMAAYLWYHGLIEDPKFVAEQGHFMRRPGEAFVEVVGPREAIETVKVGGFAVDVMRGELVSPEMYDAG